MRAFVTVCAMAAIAAGALWTGNYDYSKGGTDWAELYNEPGCEVSVTRHQSPIDIITADAIKKDGLSVTVLNYGKANQGDITSVTNLGETINHPAVNMNLCFRTSET